MANNDRYQNPHARPSSGRPPAGQRPTEGQRPRPPRQEARYRDDYVYDRRPPARRRRKRHTGVIVFFTFLIAFLIGAYGGVWAENRFIVSQYLPGIQKAETTPPPVSLPTIVPTDTYVEFGETAKAQEAEDLEDEFVEDTNGGWPEDSGALEEVQEEENLPEVTPEPEPEPTEAPTPEPVSYTAYKKGDRADEIKPIQAKLIELGLLSDNADGVFGAKTESALKAYQKSVGLTESGIADAETQATMFEMVAPTEAPTEPPVEIAREETTPSANIILPFGERNIVDNFCAIRLDQFGFDYEIMPSKEDENVIPTFITMDADDKTFLYLDGVIENLAASDISSQIIGFTAYTASADYVGYAAFEVNDGMSITKNVNLAPGDTTRLVLVAEVPVELSQSSEAIGAHVVIGDMMFQINVR